MKSRYIECNERDIHQGARFDVPMRNQGQHIEVAYGGFGRYENDEGAPFKRVTDRSVGTGQVTFYRLAPAGVAK